MNDLNKTALAAAKEALGYEPVEPATIEAAIVVYLAALPAPEKPARVEPKDNPHKKTYVRVDPWDFSKRLPFHDRLSSDSVYQGIDALCAVTHVASWNAGWYHDPKTGEPIERNVGEVIALMHSELSEALEGYRKGRMDDHLPNRLQIEVEFADAVIRIADTCGHLGLDLAGAIVEKMRYNSSREDHKPEARAKGGKAF